MLVSSLSDAQKSDCARLLQDPALQRLLRALTEAGATARVIGGAVRDALAGRRIVDIDLAIDQPPENTIAILSRHHIDHAPTGIAHGTVTAIIDHRGFEITSLRRDVSTDGRRATIAYTDDWRQDAMRRDFTINALSLDSHGAVFDYTNGLQDLAARRIRFIGDAATRIREDVLRILRFYRFQASFGDGTDTGAVDAAARLACKEMAGLLPHLSAERVWREISKLLTATDPTPVWQMMLEDGVLSHWLPEAHAIDALCALVACEKGMGEPPHALRRLMTLLSCDEAAAAQTAKRLKCANREAGQLAAIAHTVSAWPAPPDARMIRRALYALKDRDGTLAVRHALLIHASRRSVDTQKACLNEAFAIVRAWAAPVFPLQGQDLLKLGMTAGPSLGVLLRQIEAWWIDGDFQADKNACLSKAEALLQQFP